MEDVAIIAWFHAYSAVQTFLTFTEKLVTAGEERKPFKAMLMLKAGTCS